MRKGLMLLALLLCVTCTLSACTGLLPDDEPETIVQVCKHTDTKERHVEYVDALWHRVYYICTSCGERGEVKELGHVVDAETGKCECGAVICTHDHQQDGECLDCGMQLCYHDHITWTGYDVYQNYHVHNGTCATCGKACHQVESHGPLTQVDGAPEGYVKCEKCGMSGTNLGG